MTETILLHATCVMIARRACLILGAPGAGKSDLALRLIDQPGRGIGTRKSAAWLVADDQVYIERCKSDLYASAPDSLAGRLEIRGLGIVLLPYWQRARLSCVISLKAFDAIERFPDSLQSRFELLGVNLPLFMIDPKMSSAPARVRAALQWKVSIWEA